jgi:hypothetical protein
MTEVFAPQTPKDRRQVVRSFKEDGTAVFGQVGVEEIAYKGRFGALAYSNTSNTISRGDKYFVLDRNDDVFRVGDDILITAVDTDCYMWGEISDSDTTDEPVRIRVFVDDISTKTGTFAEWELQVVARPKPGIEKDTSTSSVDPTGDGPFTFTVTAGKFFPLGGQLLLKPTTDRSIALLGRVLAYEGTTLVVSKNETNAVTPTSYDSWSIALLDAPPADIPLIGISGLLASGSGTNVTVNAGSVMDSTGTVLLTLDDNLTKSVDAVFAAGASQGCVVKVALTGTITDTAGTITGVGTNFRGEVVDPSTGAARMDEFTALGGNLDNWSFGTLYPMISASGHGALIYEAASDTSMKTVDPITASGASFSRGALRSESAAGGNYFQGFIVLIRKDDDGTVDWCISSATPTGVPDLPSGYTYYRVIAGFVRKVADTTWYFIHHLHDASAPFAPDDARYLIVDADSRLPNARTLTDSISNHSLANMAAYTLKGRNAGTTGDPSDIDITALTEKTTPHNDDLLLLVDSEASNAFKKVKKSNIAGAGGGGDDDSYASALERLADIAGAAQFTYGDAITWFADSFDATTYVDTANSTNEDTGTAGEVKNTVSGGSNIFTGGSTIGDMTSNGGLAAAFDGTTSQASASCAAKITASNGYVGKTLASPSAVASAMIYGSNNNGYQASANPDITVTLYGKTGAAPANGTDGTSIGSLAFTDTANESAGRAITMTDTTTVWDHVWAYIVKSGAAATFNCAELVAISPATGANDLDLRSTVIEVGPSSVSTVTIWALVELLSGSITLNTNLELYASRNGGSTFTEGTAAELIETVDGYSWIKSEIDVSGQSAGNDVVLRLKTNSTSPEIALKGWVAKIT